MQKYDDQAKIRSFSVDCQACFINKKCQHILRGYKKYLTSYFRLKNHTKVEKKLCKDMVYRKCHC